MAIQDRVDIADTVGYLVTAATPVRVDTAAILESADTVATQAQAGIVDTLAYLAIVAIRVSVATPVLVYLDTAATLAGLHGREVGLQYLRLPLEIRYQLLETFRV